MAAATPGAGSPGDRRPRGFPGTSVGPRPILDNSWARRGTLALWDAACWTLATAVVLGVRLDFAVSDIQWRSTLRYLVISMVVLVLFGYVTKFYRGRFRVGSFDEVTGLAGQFAIVGISTALLFTLLDPTLPRSIPVLVPPIALVSAAAGRWLFRTYRDRNAPAQPRATSRGRSCTAPATPATSSSTLLRAERNPDYQVVGLIDDNPAKRYLRLARHPRRRRSRRRWSRRPSELDADTVILAITSASGEFVGTLQDEVNHARARVPHAAAHLGDDRWPGRASAASARSTSPTSSAATRSTPTWVTSPTTSRVVAC